MTKEEVSELDLTFDDEAAVDAFVAKIVRHENAECICEKILENCVLVRLQLRLRQSDSDLMDLKGILPKTIEVLEHAMSGFAQEVAQIRDDVNASLSSTRDGVSVQVKNALSEAMDDFSSTVSTTLNVHRNDFEGWAADIKNQIGDLASNLARNYREWLANAAGLASEEYAQSQLNRNMEQYIRELSLLKERFVDILGEGLSASDVLKELSAILTKISKDVVESLNTKTGAGYAQVLVDALKVFKTKNVRVTQEGSGNAIY